MLHRFIILKPALVLVFSLSNSIANADDYRVEVVRSRHINWQLTYEVLPNASGKSEMPCFQATVDYEVWIRVKGVRGSSFRIYEGGAWGYLGETLDCRSGLSDHNGDGLFDAYDNFILRPISLGDGMFEHYDTVPCIRFGNRLVKVKNSRGANWSSPLEDSEHPDPRRFTFKGNHFVVSSDQSAATDRSYSLPSSEISVDNLAPTPNEMERRVNELSWKTDGLYGPPDQPLERKIVLISHEEKTNSDKSHKIKFATLHDVPVDVTIEGDRVTRWQYGDVFSQEFVYGENSKTYCSKFSVGPFEYTDRNGDGKIDAFYNSKADEHIEIRPDSLVPIHRRSSVFSIYLMIVVALLLPVLAWWRFRKYLLGKENPPAS
jgi:hypothetical protein